MPSLIGDTNAQSCGCVGPQNGEPLCPCMMRGMIKRDGRWIRPEQDLGPVVKSIDKALHDIEVDWGLD